MRDRDRTFVAASIAALTACGARSELERTTGAGGSTSSADAAATTSSTGPVETPVCAPGDPVVVLAQHLTWPYGIVTDAMYVYFTTYDNVDGALWRVPKQGGSPEALSSGLDYPDQLVLVGDSLYVTEAGANRIIRLPKEGGPPVPVATGQGGPSGIATDGSALYWVNYFADEIVRSTFDGVTTILGSATDPFRIAVGTDRVYFTAAGPDVRWIMNDGSEAGRIPSPAPRTVAFSAGKLFWTDGGVLHTNSDGSEPMSFGDLEDGTFWDGLAADEDFVFAAVGTGNIWRFSRHSDPPSLVADGQDLPAIVTVDASCVYWTNTSVGSRAGSVMRAPR